MSHQVTHHTSNIVSTYLAPTSAEFVKSIFQKDQAAKKALLSKALHLVGMRAFENALQERLPSSRVLPSSNTCRLGDTIKVGMVAWTCESSKVNKITKDNTESDINICEGNWDRFELSLRRADELIYCHRQTKIAADEARQIIHTEIMRRQQSSTNDVQK